jgi:hypothetical protein
MKGEIFKIVENKNWPVETVKYFFERMQGFVVVPVEDVTLQ